MSLSYLNLSKSTTLMSSETNLNSNWLVKIGGREAGGMIFHREVPENSISVRKESRLLSTCYGPVTVLSDMRQDNNLEY